MRPREALEASQSFSLRDVVQTPAPSPVATGAKGGLSFRLDLARPKPAAAAVPMPTAAPAGLNLRFAGMQAPEPPKQAPSLAALSANTFAPTPRRASPVPAAVAAPAADAEQPAPLRGWSLRGPQRGSPLGDLATEKKDVMRLSAYVDDLTSRLQSTQSKLDSTELKLARTSQVLFAERQTHGSTIASIKKELGLARETEAKLKVELKARPAKAEAEKAAFAKSVETALNADVKVEETSVKLTELSAKVDALASMKATFEAELEVLGAAKAAALGESDGLHERNVDSSQKLAAYAAELELHGEKVAAAVKRTDAAEAAALAAEAKEAACTERAEIAYEAALRAEAESTMRCELANEGVEAAAAALAAMQMRTEKLQVQAEAMEAAAAASAIPVLELPPSAEVGGCGGGLHTPPPWPSGEGEGEESEESEDEDEDEGGGCPCSSAPPAATEAEDELRRATCAPESPGMLPVGVGMRGRVFGASPPELGLRCDTAAAKLAALPWASSVAAVAAHDVPVSIGATFVPAAQLGVGAAPGAGAGAGDATSLLVNAVVADLKSKWQSSLSFQPASRFVAPLA